MRLLTPPNPPISDWREQRVWIVGASSGIGAALARELLARGARVALSARRAEALAGIAAGVPEQRTLIATVDVTDATGVAAAQARIVDDWGGIDLTIWVAGTYSPMGAAQFDLGTARRIARTNFEGVLNGLAALIPMLQRQRRGGVALVSSVAGYRGLPRSIVYGPTKAALINMAESLYLELHPLGLAVYLVNPGFVRTPLTDLNEFPMPGLVSPELAATRIADGLEAGRFEIHFPRRFTWLMKALRIMPQRLYFLLAGRLTRGDSGTRREAGSAAE